MVEAFVLVRVEAAKIDEFLNLMKVIKGAICKTVGIMEIKGVFGRYDFVIRIKAKTVQDLSNLIMDCIRTSHGVAETETLLVGHLETSPNMREMIDNLYTLL